MNDDGLRAGITGNAVDGYLIALYDSRPGGPPIATQWFKQIDAARDSARRMLATERHRRATRINEVVT